jgi:hypothetical protein
VSLPAPLVEKTDGGRVLRWGFGDPRWEAFGRWWVVQALIDGQWQTVEVSFRDRRELAWPGAATAVAIRAAGRAWELGPAAVLTR